MFIDSHCHLSKVELKDEYISNIENSDDVYSIIDVGMDLESSINAVMNANHSNKIYAACGIHPSNAQENIPLTILHDLLFNPRVVALGEIGLEPVHFESMSLLQKKLLIEQIMIANEFKLPVIIHANNNQNEIKEIFEKHVKPKYGCVFHCFQPDMEFLKYVIDNGFYISFAGRILKPNAKRSIEVIKSVPKELYMVETDAPFIEIPGSPESNSIYLNSVLRRISEIREEDIEDVANQSIENTKRLFYKMK